MTEGWTDPLFLKEPPFFPNVLKQACLLTYLDGDGAYQPTSVSKGGFSSGQDDVAVF